VFVGRRQLIILVVAAALFFAFRTWPTVHRSTHKWYRNQNSRMFLSMYLCLGGVVVRGIGLAIGDRGFNPSHSAVECHCKQYAFVHTHCRCCQARGGFMNLRKGAVPSFPSPLPVPSTSPPPLEVGPLEPARESAGVM